MQLKIALVELGQDAGDAAVAEMVNEVIVSSICECIDTFLGLPAASDRRNLFQIRGQT